MQLDQDPTHSTAIDDAQDDDGSLFGSPPPSPTLSGRGRSPLQSPLALPSGAGSSSNVGTLALPGSHLVAELPVVLPPALPSAPPMSTAQPARSSSQGASVSRPSPPATRAARSSSITSVPARRKQKSRAKTGSASSSVSSTPRPTPPISLPSPGTQPPPNFLRNQEALLGLAGVVGGVKPAQLQQTRGTTSRNPINVDELPEPPLSHAPPPREPPSLSRNPRPPPVDPSQLPPPPPADVIHSLLRQKNIIPVLGGLLRFLSNPTPPVAPSPYSATTGWHRRSSNAPPPLKRRRLNSVPAGAADWDVPYPFEKGQGPSNYTETWARERGRNLIVDLVRLLQGAAQKAALKSYMAQRQGRPETMRYGAPAEHYHPPSDWRMGAMSTPVAGQPPGSQAWHPPGPGSTAQDQQQQMTPEDSFDQLLASLLAATHTESAPPTGMSPEAAVPSMSDSSAQAGASTYVDDWLALLNTSPPGVPGDTASDWGSIFDFIIAENSNSSTEVAVPATADPTGSSTPGLPQPQTNNSPVHPPDLMVDPALLSFMSAPDPSLPSASSREDATPKPTASSAAQPVPGSNTTVAADTNAARPSTPMLVGSPLASASSLAADPPTPDWSWEFPQPEPGQGTSPEPQIATTETGEQDSLSSVDMRTTADDELEQSEPKSKGKGRAREDMQPVSGAVPDIQEPSMPLARTQGQVEASGSTAFSEAQPLPRAHSPVRQLSQPQLHAPAPVIPSTPADFLMQSFTMPSRPTSQPQPHVYAPHTHMYSSAPQTSTVTPTPAAQVSGQRQPLFPPQFVPSAASYSALSRSPYLYPPSYPVSLTPSSSTSLAQTPRPAPTRINRASVLARARALRDALTAEAQRAKVELWEATLEHAVLVNLGKDEAAARSS
ncbi:hypothetical protein OBBRIDRAFT_140389 [Obba rivulosa]|uniref:Uncharacterized protein n=1 Tax=Obba rivulosa TaxID=1052685 RepID=A0A8E2DR70_9APHY|nr:hypothetical protein OBBRIDRAFT_140389 [Obba rivulosa]